MQKNTDQKKKSCSDTSYSVIYKAFIRPHPDYGDVFYDKPHNFNLNENLKKVQQQASLAITGAITETNGRLYKKWALNV